MFDIRKIKVNPGLPRFFLTVLIFVLSFILFSHRLVSSFNFDSDFGRDLSDILVLTKEKPLLTGPKLSFGGFFAGPYYYYLFAPFLLLSRLDPQGVLIGNVLLFSLSLAVFFYFFSKLTSFSFSFLASLWLATSSYFFFSARNPGNAFSYLPLLLSFFVLFVVVVKNNHKLLLFALGFLGGVVVNFHFINLLIFVPLFLFVLIFGGKNKLRNLSLLVCGFAISFLPLILFEMRHNFVMFKNTFLSGSYKLFIENKNLPTNLEVSKNPLENLFLITKYINQWIIFDIRLQLLWIVGFLIFLYKKIAIEEKILVLSSLLSFILLITFARFQFVYFYLFPFVLFIQFIFLLTIAKFKLGKIIVFILLLLNLFFFSAAYFKESTRNYKTLRTVVEQVLKDRIIVKNDDFNIYVIRETPIAATGWDYRYFFKSKGVDPQPPDQYKQSKKLLLISEKGSLNLKDIASWEISEFGGLENVVMSKQISDRIVYLIEK
jgi:hypothetical protein